MKLTQWPTYCTCATDERLPLEKSALETPYWGQFTLPTQFTNPHYLVIPLFSPSPPPTPSKAALRKLPLLFKWKLTLSLSHTQKLLDWEFSTLIIPLIFSAFPEITIPWTGTQTESRGREEKFYYGSCKTPSLTPTNLVSHRILHLFQIVWSRMDILFGLVLLEDPC